MFRRHATRHLSAYHHGELTPEGKERVETHLQTCSRCRAAFEEIQFGSKLASVLRVSNVPGLAWEALHDVRVVPAGWTWLAVAAGSLATATLVLLILVRSHAPAGPSWEVDGF